MSREDELYKLCHNATKMSINNEMFSVDRCCKECVWLYGDEYGEETIIYFADMVEAEKSGDSIVFYNLHKMEDNHKSKHKKYISNSDWYTLFMYSVSAFRIGCKHYRVLEYNKKFVIAMNDEGTRETITYRELRDYYKVGTIKLYKEEEICLKS